MRIIVMISMLLVMFGLFFNAGRQILIWLMLPFKNINRPVYWVIYGVMAVTILALFVVSRRPGMGDYRVLFRFDHYALGVLFYVVFVANAASLLLVLGRLLRLLPSPTPRGVQLAAGILSLLSMAGFSIYGVAHASDFQIRRYTVMIGGEQEELEPLRMVLLSDIHLGYMIDEKHLGRVVQIVNAIAPDIVCIAGDIFDGDMTALFNKEELQALFSQIKTKYGVYACLGNHDAGASYREMLKFLEGAGVWVLQDEATLIDRRFVLVGRKDSSPIGDQGAPRWESGKLPETETFPVIVMDHQPGNMDEYGSEVDLILCGHTHQGQMFPFNLITNAVFKVDYGYYTSADFEEDFGYYRTDGTAPQVIVTSGVGTWGPPLRVGTDNEIVEINMFLPRASSSLMN